MNQYKLNGDLGNQIQCQRQSTLCSRAHFSDRVVNCWKSLRDIVDFSSFTRFELTVKRLNLAQFLKFQVCNLFVICIVFIRYGPFTANNYYSMLYS